MHIYRESTSYTDNIFADFKKGNLDRIIYDILFWLIEVRDGTKYLAVLLFLVLIIARILIAWKVHFFRIKFVL